MRCSINRACTYFCGVTETFVRSKLWFIRYIFYRNLQFLNHIIIIGIVTIDDCRYSV